MSDELFMEVGRARLDAVSARQKDYDFGFGYLWCRYQGDEILIGSILAKADHPQIQLDWLEAMKAEGYDVETTWVNMD